MSGREIRNLLTLAAVASLLLVALGGWAWVVMRTLDNERELVAADLEAQRRDQLDRLARQLEAGLEEANLGIVSSFEESTDPQAWYAERLEDGFPSGVDFPHAPSPSTATSGSFGSWKKSLDPGEPSDLAPKLIEAIRLGKPGWSVDGSGRDPLASFALDIAKRSSNEELAGLVHQRACDLRAPLKPSYRLFLLGQLSDHPVPARLLIAETLRMSEGTPPPDLEPIERVSLASRKGELISYWSMEDLAALIGGFPEGIQLSPTGEATSYARRIPSLEKNPFLALDEASGELFGKTTRLLGTIGVASGLLLAALVIGAVLFAHHHRRLAETRTDLAASVAHELRTPLAGQRLALESLSSGSTTSESAKDYLAMALRENLRLGHLAEEFLTFSRLERGALRLDSEELDLRQTIDDAIGPMSQILEKADFAIVAPDPVRILGDPEALATVIRNLVENAVKYSDGPAWIRIHCFQRDNQAVLEVVDHGQGIPSISQKRIFHQFHRLDDSLARKNDGLGLGLTIVRRIVEAHDGQIELDSEPGRGSTFRLLLPSTP